MDEAVLIGAIVGWCSPEFAASARAMGIGQVEGSHADVESMRTIYEHRRRQASGNPALLELTEGVLQALESVRGPEIEMLHFTAGLGHEGIVLADLAGTPVFAFAISTSEA